MISSTDKQMFIIIVLKDALLKFTRIYAKFHFGKQRLKSKSIIIIAYPPLTRSVTVSDTESSPADEY